MIDESIKKALAKLDGKLKFNNLLKFIEDTGVTFKDRRMTGPLGIATLDCIYLDINQLNRYEDRFVYFVILHETAHFKRITKMGRAVMLKNLSMEDFDELLTHIFFEEILADRYACKMFYHFNRDIYPWSHTQQLNLPSKQLQYHPMARNYFGKIQNDEKKYYELIEQFIKK
jgi:hypothetical protein